MVVQKGSIGRKGKSIKTLEQRKREKRERVMREVAKAKTENKVREIMNRGRKSRKRMNEGIGNEQWKEYLKALL